MYVKLKKKYGQNFLVDKNIINKIINLINFNNLRILEIGPGDGKLTSGILNKKPKKLDLIEIDKELFNGLCKSYQGYDFIEIKNEDILKTNIKDNYDLLISNLPYNISSQVLLKIVLLNKAPNDMILMFQKEFALRLLENNLNAINSIIKCFYNIKLVFNVSRNCFRPIPKVDSSVLKFEKLEKSLIENNEIKKFIEFKRYLFSYKRKSLKNLLKKYEVSKSYDLELRVEKLKLVDLISIFREISL